MVRRRLQHGARKLDHLDGLPEVAAKGRVHHLALRRLEPVHDVGDGPVDGVVGEVDILAVKVGREGDPLRRVVDTHVGVVVPAQQHLPPPAPPLSGHRGVERVCLTLSQRQARSLTEAGYWGLRGGRRTLRSSARFFLNHLSTISSSVSSPKTMGTR